MSFEIDDKTINEHIANDIDRMICHGWYSQYGFKSLGQILAFIYGYSNQLRIAERVTVYESIVTLYEQALCTYTWDEERKIPIFKFVEMYKGCNARQKIYLEWLNKQEVITRS